MSRNRIIYKPDERFKEDLIKGAVGLSFIRKLFNERYGHDFVYLEEWGASTQIVKDKRLKKRRTTDLICRKCGMRIEVRAKTRDMISMSDSTARPFEREHSEEDWVAFPIINVITTEPREEGTRFIIERIYEVKGVYLVKIKELIRTKNLARRIKKPPSEEYLVWKEEEFNVLENFYFFEVDREVKPFIDLLKCPKS